MALSAGARTDGFDLVLSKNTIIPEVMSIFRESDRRDYRSPANPDSEVVGSDQAAESPKESHRVVE